MPRAPRKTIPQSGYVTICDIADKAGVSVNSVSRALNDKSDIGAETKERIRRIADELGYIRHAAASGMRSGGTKSIGVIVTHIDNPFFSGILQGINDCVSQNGYTVLMLVSDENVETEAKNIRLLMAYRVSGVLLVPACDLKNTIDYQAIQAPYIEIVRHIPDAQSAYFVSDSNLSGTLAAERFIATGRRRCAYLGFDKPVSCNRSRMNGFAKRLRKEKLQFDSQSVRACSADADTAFKTMMQWIAEGFDYDGLFAYNDAMAFGAIRAFSDSGLRVPHDVSVIGHDDIEIAESFIPRLTTIRVPKYRLGYESAGALLELIEPPPEGPLLRRVVYKPELIIRET